MNDSLRICPLAARRPARAIRRDIIVATSVGAEGIDCAYRDYGRLIAGSVNGSIDLSTVRVLAVVAGSRDDHNSRVDQCASGATDWIVFVRANRRCAQA